MGFFKNLLLKPSDVAKSLGTDVLEVVGESYNESSFKRLLSKQELEVEGGTEKIVKGSIQHEKKNKHDPNAVVVHAKFHVVGHLDRATAAKVAPILDKRGGGGLFVKVRVWGQYRPDGSVFASARVLLED